jgi:trans-aconitate 3-methyltransferase
VDLGCGTGECSQLQHLHVLTCGLGQATTDLTQFKRVVGVDPSESMVVGARKYTESLGIVNCEYVRSPAEDLHFLENGSVDLIVAGS